MFFMKLFPLLTISFIIAKSYHAINIDDFGAISNDSSYNASIINGKALNLALKAANQSQNDRIVEVSANKVYTMLPLETVEYLTNMTLQIDGRINAWEGDEDKWPNDAGGGALTLISLENSYGLIIRGNGVIDGFGYPWWWSVIIDGHDNRPNLLDLNLARNLLIDGLTFLNSPRYHINVLNSLNVTIQNILIHVDINFNYSIFNFVPTFPLNTDGIDISGKDIYFRNLTITNFDDAVAVKPIYTFGSPYSNCTENLLIEDSYVKYGVGMSIGSVPPNENVKCIRNVTFRNIYFQNPLKAIYIKPNPGSSGKGLISHITYENIEIHEAIWWAIFIGTQQQQQPHSSGTGCSFFFPLPGTKCQTDPLVTVEFITLRNVKIYGGVLSPGVLVCNETNPCSNFLFDNVNVYNMSTWPIEDGYYCQNVIGYANNTNIYPKNCFTDVSKWYKK